MGTIPYKQDGGKLNINHTTLDYKVEKNFFIVKYIILSEMRLFGYYWASDYCKHVYFRLGNIRENVNWVVCVWLLSYKLVNGFRVIRDIVSSQMRGTIRVDEEKPFTHQFSSLFAPKTFFVVQSLISTLLEYCKVIAQSKGKLYQAI